MDFQRPDIVFFVKKKYNITAIVILNSLISLEFTNTEVCILKKYCVGFKGYTDFCT